ncbi:MAG: metalloenzyme [Roseiflexaceae bacterium]|nr:metalloenzyme [Roseiflexaceae bacterium]
MALIFVFLDGVGLAPGGPDNPLSDAPTPHLHALLGGPLVLETAQTFYHREVDSIVFKPIDATLGIVGLPQSGTGQTALLAGVNAAALHGRHQPHVPPVALRQLLAEQNILRRVAQRGGRATFANAFTPAYWQALAARRIRKSASVIAAEGAGLRFRDLEDLQRGAAVAWDVSGAAMRGRGEQITLVSPTQAGTALARLAHDHDLVFYENFLPDLAGHGRAQQTTHEVFALLDSFLGAVMAAQRPQDTLLLSSDHGNIESIASPGHTRNPVPLLAVGAKAAAFDKLISIIEIAGIIDEVTR